MWHKRSFGKHLFSAFLLSLLLSCQGIQTRQSGALSFSVQFPERSFQLQAIPDDTTQIGVALFENEALTEFQVLTPQSPQLVIGNLNIGPKKVMAFALNSQIEVLTGAHAQTEVLAGQRTQVELNLEANWESTLTQAEQDILQLMKDALRIPPSKRQFELSCGPLKRRKGINLRSIVQDAGFKIQTLPPQSRYIGISALDTQTQELLSLRVVDLNNLQVLLKNLPIGELDLYVFSLDAALSPLTGSFQRATINANGTSQITMNLERNFETQLTAPQQQTYTHILSALNSSCEPRVKEIITPPNDNTDPLPPQTEPDPSAEPSPEPSVEPSLEPSPEPSSEPSVEPSPEPSSSPTPQVTPSPIIRSGSLGGGGGPVVIGGGTPSATPEPTPTPTPVPTPTPTPEIIDLNNGGGSINIDITVEDGNPLPPPIVVN